MKQLSGLRGKLIALCRQQMLLVISVDIGKSAV